MQAEIWLSGTTIVGPSFANMWFISCSCGIPSLIADMKVMLSSTSTAVFGITLNIAGKNSPFHGIPVESHSSIWQQGIPAATETIICFCGSRENLISSINPCISQGFTANTTISAPFTAATLSVSRLNPGFVLRSFSRVPAVLAVQVIASSAKVPLFARPRAIAPPILPAPIIVTFIFVKIFKIMQ